MAIEKEKKDLKKNFICLLAESGTDLIKIGQKPLIYQIEDKLYNIKTCSIQRSYTYGGTSYHFEINQDVIKNIDYTVFILDNIYHIFLIPSSLLIENWQKLYDTKNYTPKDLSRRFTIVNKDNLKIILIKDSIVIEIEKYFHDLNKTYPFPIKSNKMKIKLIEIASARSGDKNNVCNIGVMAKSKEDYATLKQFLTPEIVKAHFRGLIKGKVERFEWDALESLNFVCHEALDGGASRSMRMDSLGKNFSSHLLRLELEISE
ncbi:MAG: hypothetical protein U0T77_09350 [Chitinophagales bacterium]